MSASSLLHLFTGACLILLISGFPPMDKNTLVGDNPISIDARTKVLHRTVFSTTRLHSLFHEDTLQRQTPQLNHALLASSFSDGIRANPEAQAFLCKGLLKALVQERRHLAEQNVVDSVVASPCNGPDPVTLESMESLDKLMHILESKSQFKASEQGKIIIDELADEEAIELRFLYIPTAMYALRSQSSQTPGKQRQRARADGKQRRNDIVQLLQQQLGVRVNIVATTLDMDDGSIKQSEGSEDSSSYPSSGREALTTWKPHFVYVQGGNTFWLYHCIKKGGWGDDLVNALTGPNAATYCGTSAGAIVMGKSMETACWKEWDDPSIVPGMETYEDWQDVKGFDLANGVSFFPHMTEDWQDLVDDKAEASPQINVCCLRDEESCCFDGVTAKIQLLSGCLEGV